MRAGKIGAALIVFAGLALAETDSESGLVIDAHWQLVKAHCSACHSLHLVTQNRGSRQTWLEMIRWMQETQGLWQFDTTTESNILDYREKNYAPFAIAGKTDPGSGLVIDENWQLVKAHCSACHSPQLVTQNRGSRQTWLEMIRWMQETQGLWSLDAQTETGILDYLEKNYAPSAVHRRAPISRSLMPQNPHGNVD
jgi:hypothetical protein